MGHMRLKTKLVLAISGMVFALVAVFCYVYMSYLVRQRTAEAYDSAPAAHTRAASSRRSRRLKGLRT